MPRLSVVVAAVAAVLGVAAGVDITRTSEARGSVVVDAVVDRIRSNCIFGDDRLFLRRLAFVETSDGTDSKTYRPGYHGGIWQIDEDKFNQISCSSSRIRDKCQLIKSVFNIDWSLVTWSDLRKPLYSGLAAALYIKYRTTSPPSNINNQASIWSSYLRSGARSSDFVTKAASLPESECRTQIDLAFILDGSGSVSRPDFITMLDFVQVIVGNLSVIDDEVHVAAIEYSSSVGTTITFNQFTTTSNLIASISNIFKGNGGTSTATAIDFTRSTLFSTSRGARPGAKRVAILITDGRSNNQVMTLQAAASAKAAGITMISVGVGNANLQEIQGVATEPNCTHVYTLNNFQEIDSLLYELKDSSCSASTSLPNPESGENTEIVRPIRENNTISETFKVNSPTGSGSSSSGSGSGSSSSGGGSGSSSSGSGSGSSSSGGGTTTDNIERQPVVKSEVTCGNLEIFASYDTPRPGPAFYDIHDIASDGKPSIIYLNTTVQGRSLYITVVASRGSSSSAITSCLNSSYTIAVTTVPVKAEVVCRVGQTERKCTEEDLKSSEYKNLLCQDDSVLTNPCIAGSKTFHAHPSDMTKFIHCDVMGKMYITQCPDHSTYDVMTNNCGNEAVGGDSSNKLPVNLINPCTQSNLANGDLYFRHPSDDSKYIQCDAFGGALVRPCPEGQKWDSQNQGCSFFDDSNVCSSQNDGTMLPHPDRNKFITCNHGHPLVQSCNEGLVYNAVDKTCGWA